LPSASVNKKARHRYRAAPCVRSTLDLQINASCKCECRRKLNNQLITVTLTAPFVAAQKVVEIEVSLAGITPKSAAGETLSGPKVDSVNSFEAPNTVVPKPISAKVQGGKLALKLEPKSVTVISVEQ
jgi:alpha-L-arabinofuranosidase